jgi:hypothetical protein
MQKTGEKREGASCRRTERPGLSGLFAPRGALRALLPDQVDMNLYFARDAL